jgi:hypothetical protein
MYRIMAANTANIPLIQVIVHADTSLYPLPARMEAVKAPTRDVDATLGEGRRKKRA